MKLLYNLSGILFIPMLLIFGAPSSSDLIVSQFVNADQLSSQTTNQQPNYYNLLPPLNIIKDKDVVDQNPKIILKYNKEFQILSRDYFNLFDNQFVPFHFFVNRDGLIENVQLYQKIMSKPLNIDQSSISAFLNKFIGVQLTDGGALKQGREVAYTTVMAFTFANDQLIMNPILH